MPTVRFEKVEVHPEINDRQHTKHFATLQMYARIRQETNADGH